ncbi:hypothetical protein NPIL_615191 [Nephila pilipes]|uniref:Uncharacterized protein n=1 Tax=Nephila pilipes TaxID=299642 RepID=A0A8X6Q6Q1_NEPPI|nr:hypothetical protein NPIL_615191 [Nephila pilipes]
MTRTMCLNRCELSSNLEEIVRPVSSIRSPQCIAEESLLFMEPETALSKLRSYHLHFETQFMQWFSYVCIFRELGVHTNASGINDSDDFEALASC